MLTILFIILWTFASHSPLRPTYTVCHFSTGTYRQRRLTDTPRWHPNFIHMKTTITKSNTQIRINKNHLHKIELICVCWWLVYNSTKNWQPIYFPSTIKPQLVTKRESMSKNSIEKSSNNHLFLFLLLGVVGEYFYFTCIAT